MDRKSSVENSNAAYTASITTANTAAMIMPQQQQQSQQYEPSWPVQLFRKTQSEGWQELSAKNSHGRAITIHATPRDGCIVIKKLRLRFTLDAKEKKSLVIRRRQCIMVQSGMKLLTFVFRFYNEADCLAFSDRFLLLNPPEVIKHPPVSVIRQDNNVADVNNPNNSSLVNRNIQISNGIGVNSSQVLCYIAQLINDPDFGEYVDALESCLHNNSDHARMIKAMVLTRSEAGAKDAFVKDTFVSPPDDCDHTQLFDHEHQQHT